MKMEKENDMAYRYTNTDKWRDGWYSKLSVLQKLLFNYLCDNCDVAGFLEVTPKIWAIEIGCTEKDILAALQGLSRVLIFSKDQDCLYIRNFLKHQKNLPLNENNNAHLGIMRRFENYSHKFDIQDVNEFLLRETEGAKEGLTSPTGKGNGKGKGKDLSIVKLFYEKELKESNNNPEYKKMIDFMFGDNILKQSLDKCLLMEDQITYEIFLKLKKKAQDNNKPLLDTLLSFEKYTKRSSYKSLYLTINNWLNLKK